MLPTKPSHGDPQYGPRERRDIQREIFDALPAGVALVRELRLQHCNACFADMLGYAIEDLVGRPVHLWQTDDPRCAEALQTDQGFHGELPLLRKDRSAVWCDVRVRALDPAAPAEDAVWMVTDASARRPAQAEPVPAQTQLHQDMDERVLALQQQVAALREQLAAQAQNESRFQRLAHFDPLTNLPNRALLAQSARQAIAQARSGSKPLAVVFLDLDRFKNINDSLGHRVGDELLTALATRFRSTVRERDTVSRLGGDEFMLILPDTDVRGAAHVAEKLIAQTAPPFVIDLHELSITPSIGIAMFPADGEDFETLTQRADAAMYQAKRDGRGVYRFFTQEMQAQAARALSLENALRRALEREQLRLFYQPMVDLRSGDVIGVEALMRWQHPDFGNVSPSEFIPVAEACGLVGMLGEWALRTALRQLKAWRAAGLPLIAMAVNLSATQLLHAHLPELVAGILAEAGLGPQDLELELTESAAMDDPQRAIAVLQDLHRRGIRVSIDDFGTGYSSLSYLKRFRAHKLKIDQSFVRDISVDPDDRAIVAAIILMASSLGLKTLAEGVETEAQLRFLRQQGCDEAQGYLFSRPLSARQLEAFVRDLQQ